MFIKKDLRKIPTILDEAVDCRDYDAAVAADAASDDAENDTGAANRNDPKKKRTKRQEPLRTLKLGRRKQEFEGTVRVLCRPSDAPKLTHLSVLNLYECDIHDLEGFGTMFATAAPKLETLNLGRNPLSKGIPDDFAKVRSLKHLWLDDCQLTGEFPKPLLQLPNIESLRLPNNQITHLSIGGIDANRAKKTARNDGEEFEFDMDDDKEVPAVVPLRNLKTLCLDRNKLGGGNKEEIPDLKAYKKKKKGTRPDEIFDEDVTDDPMDVDLGSGPADDERRDGGPGLLPSNLAEWAPNLEECFLRHNNFRELGVRAWPPTLRILQLSSNRLANLDDLVGAGSSPALTHLYANGNRLRRLPEGILADHPKLRRLVVSHNPPLSEMPPEAWRAVESQKNKGDDRDGGDRRDCEILWKPNPNLRPPWPEDDDDTKDKNKHVC